MPFVAHLEQSDSIVRRLVKEVETISAHSLDPWTATRCPARQIGIVLFEGFSLLRAGIIAEVFNKANQLAKPLVDQAKAAFDQANDLYITVEVDLLARGFERCPLGCGR